MSSKHKTQKRTKNRKVKKIKIQVTRPEDNNKLFYNDKYGPEITNEYFKLLENIEIPSGKASNNPYSIYMMSNIFEEHIAKNQTNKFYDELRKINNVDSPNVVFALPTFDNFRSKENEDVSVYNISQNTGVTGIMKCASCKSANTFSLFMQISAADEAQTQILRCHDCGASQKLG